MDAKQLLEILACPQCHADLVLLSENGKSGFLCENCQKVYPICEDIPVMLIDAAIPRSDWPANAPTSL